MLNKLLSWLFEDEDWITDFKRNYSGYKKYMGDF